MPFKRSDAGFNSRGRCPGRFVSQRRPGQQPAHGDRGRRGGGAGSSAIRSRTPRPRTSSTGSTMMHLMRGKSLRPLGLQLREIEIKPEVASLWPHLLYHLDEPIADPAAISCYLISKLARESGTTVLLSGQGADELFCGYPRRRRNGGDALAGEDPWPVRARSPTTRPGCREPREGTAGPGCGGSDAWRRPWTRTPTNAFSPTASATPETEIRRILSPARGGRAPWASLQGRLPCNTWRRAACGVGARAGSRRHDLLAKPQPALHRQDGDGRGARSPGSVPRPRPRRPGDSLPGALEVQPGTTKALLRDAARGLVSDAIIDRRKAGFRPLHASGCGTT